MPDVVEFIEWVGYAILFGLFVIVTVRVITGEISTHRLISGKNADGTQFVSASRFQVLVVTLTLAAQYLWHFRQNPHSLPDVPQSWLLLLGGSHLIYHGNKFQGARKKRFDI